MGLRITDLGLSSSRMNWIGQSESKVATAEQQVATGRRINKASDSPSESTRLLRYDQRLQRIAQFSRYADNAKLWVSTADQALQTGSTELQRARTLVVQAGNDTLGPQERQAIAADIRAVRDGLLATANTKISGRAIFAGTAGSDSAYDGTGAYVGDTGDVIRTLDTNETVAVGYHGPAIFGAANTGDPMNGNVFEMLGAVADAIENGDVAAMRSGITAIDSASTRIGTVQGRVGAATQQLDAASERQQTEQLSTQDNVSKIRDVDISEAVIQLRSAELSYDATLSATARTLSRSLLDFLH